MWPLKKRDEQVDNLAEFILQQIRDNPDSWKFTEHTVVHASGVEVWTSNGWEYLDIWAGYKLAGSGEPTGKMGIKFSKKQKTNIFRGLADLKKSRENIAIESKASKVLELMVAHQLNGGSS